MFQAFFPSFPPEASDRSVLPPANGDGETPEMLAAIAGHGELCHALEAWLMDVIYIYTLWLFNIAMENGPFIDGLPSKNGDIPWLC